MKERRKGRVGGEGGESWRKGFARYRRLTRLADAMLIKNTKAH